MLSVIIPTEGVEQTAVATLAALVPGAAAGIIREVLLVDRGDNNGVIERVADIAGCGYLRFEGTRAAALAAGARQARSPWLMFLRPGAVLNPRAVLALQSTVGNAAVARMIRGATSPTRVAASQRVVARDAATAELEQASRDPSLPAKPDTAAVDACVVAAYRRGFPEGLLMRGVDVVLAIPQLVFVLLLMSVIGPMDPTPAAPSTIRTLSAASGPYAAEESASRPRIGMPAHTPTRWPSSSAVASGRPTYSSGRRRSSATSTRRLSLTR